MHVDINLSRGEVAGDCLFRHDNGMHVDTIQSWNHASAHEPMRGGVAGDVLCRLMPITADYNVLDIMGLYDCAEA